jgi:hypothetical protein
MKLIENIKTALGLSIPNNTKPKKVITEATGSTSGQISQANIKNFVVKAVGNVSEGSNGDFTSSSYDLSEIKDAIAADSYIKLAITKYSQLVFKAGYNIVSQNDAAAEYIRSRFRMMGFMTGTPMDVVLQQVADDLVSYSNAFLVKSRVDMTNIGGLQAKGILDTKPVGGYFRVDPSTVQIKTDKTGTIKQYQQQSGQNTTKFKPTDVIHIYMDKQGGELFGTPRIVAAMEDVKLLRKIEGNVLTLIYRFAIPLYQMKIGLPEAGFMATDQEITDAKNEVEKLASDGILVTNERTEFDAIGAEGTALDATGYLNYFEKRVFAALNMSEAMMGRGGAKQDADSMEQQIHDSVKYFQRTLEIFIEEKLINELLLEGGYNPIMNEQDIVQFQFEEIDLDTKVKMESHAMNQFQGNAIPFEEMRTQLGQRADNVDESRLYDNMIKQPNALALVNAKLSQSGTGSASANTGTSGPSKTKTTNGTIKNTMQPRNQHGTTTANIKESFLDLKESSTQSNIDKYKKNFPSVFKKYTTTRNDVCEHGVKAYVALPLARDSIVKELKSQVAFEAQGGIQKALKDSGKKPDALRKVSLKLINDKIETVTTNMFKDIRKRLNTAKTYEDREAAFNAVEYRMRFLCEEIISKARWFGYVKACSQLGIDQVYVNFGKSDDNETHDAIVHTNKFSLDDIPAFHAYCTCKIGLEKAGDK